MTELLPRPILSAALAIFAKESRPKIFFVKSTGSMDMFLQTANPVWALHWKNESVANYAFI